MCRAFTKGTNSCNIDAMNLSRVIFAEETRVLLRHELCVRLPVWPSGKALGWQADDVGSILRFGSSLWTPSCDVYPPPPPPQSIVRDRY